MVNDGGITASFSSAGDAATALVGTGSYTITATLSDPKSELANYTVHETDAYLTVNKATLTITANSDSKTYGTLKTFSSATFSETGLVTANNDTITGVTETSTGTPASPPVGTYNIVASSALGSGLTNYNVSYATGTLTVNPGRPDRHGATAWPPTAIPRPPSATPPAVSRSTRPPRC